MTRLLSLLWLLCATAALAAEPAKPLANIEIWSDEFEFSSEKRIGVYTGNVRLVDPPDMELHCRKLTASLPTDGGKIERIIAEDDVVIRLHEMQNGRRVLRTAKGRRGVYEAATNRVTLTGEPYIEVAEGRLTADEVILDRSAGLLRARGNVHMVLDEAALTQAKEKKTPAPK